MLRVLVFDITAVAKARLKLTILLTTPEIYLRLTVLIACHSLCYSGKSICISKKKEKRKKKVTKYNH
jgi:hypothetical protein